MGESNSSPIKEIAGIPQTCLVGAGKKKKLFGGGFGKGGAGGTCSLEFIGPLNTSFKIGEEKAWKGGNGENFSQAMFCNKCPWFASL